MVKHGAPFGATAREEIVAAWRARAELQVTPPEVRGIQPRWDLRLSTTESDLLNLLDTLSSTASHRHRATRATACWARKQRIDILAALGLTES